MEGRKKGKLYRYSVCSRKPAWLLDLQWQVVCRYGEDEVEDTPGFWQELERYINFCIYEWHKNTDRKRSIRSTIGTRVEEDEGITVLDVLRNRRPVLTYKIK